MDNDRRHRLKLLALAVAFECGLGALAWGLGLLLGRPVFEHFRWGARDAALGAAACVPMLLVFLALVRWPVGPLREIRQFCEEAIRPLFAPCTVLDLAIISLTAGIGEEMLFRAVAQEALSVRLGWAAGLVIASALFGLAHPITPTYVVIAFVLGLYLGWVWTASGNLLVVIIAHALYDFAALLYLLRRRPTPAEAVPITSEDA